MTGDTQASTCSWMALGVDLYHMTGCPGHSVAMQSCLAEARGHQLTLP